MLKLKKERKKTVMLSFAKSEPKFPITINVLTFKIQTIS